MPPRLIPWIFAVVWVLIPLEAYAAQSKLVITRLDTQFLDNNVNINVHWQSRNPVVLVRVLAGTDQKEVKVDEYDNKRNPRGYSGEVTVVLNVQPRPGVDFISYVVYLEDDLRQKSEQMTGRAKVPAAPAGQIPGMPGIQVGVGVQVGVQTGPMPPPGTPGMQTGIDPNQPAAQPGGIQPGFPGGQPGAPAAPPPGFQVGTPPGGDPGGQAPGPTGMITLTPTPGGRLDQFGKVMSQIDVPPYFSEIRVNRFQSNNITITGKVVDDKGLKEINFRIFDAAGNKGQEQTITSQGRVWHGTTNPFTLPPGRYKVIAQAVDMGGNSSKERTAEFEITGQGQVLQTPSVAPPMTPEQTQAFSDPSSASFSQPAATDPQGSTGQQGGPGQSPVQQ
jgi:hypothetical protein